MISSSLATTGSLNSFRGLGIQYSFFPQSQHFLVVEFNSVDYLILRFSGIIMLPDRTYDMGNYLLLGNVFWVLVGMGGQKLFEVDAIGIVCALAVLADAQFICKGPHLARWILGIVSQSISEIDFSVARFQVLFSTCGILLVSTAFKIDELQRKTVFS